MKKRNLLWLPVLWSLIVQVLLSLPGSMFPGGGMLFNIPYLDKIAHLVLFGGLCLFWNLFLYYKRGEKSGSSEWVVVVLSSSYGIVMEYVQFYFIPKRSFDKGDIVADIVGSLIGYLITQWFIQWQQNRLVYKKN